MKKIFTKLIGVTLGLAMAVGVGVGVAANNGKATMLDATEGDIVDTMTVASFDDAPSSYTTDGTEYSKTGPNSSVIYQATGITSGGNIRGNKAANTGNFNLRNSTTKDGYYVSRVRITESGGTMDPATSNRSVLIVGATVFAKITDATVPSGTQIIANEESAGTTLTFDNDDTSVAYFQFYSLKTSGTCTSASIEITWSVAASSATKHDLTYAVGAQGVYDGATTKTFSVAESGTHTVKTPAEVGISANQGYVFSTWSDGVNNYNPSSTYTMGTSNVTLTAQWVAGVALSYNGNGATSGSVTTTYVASGGTQIVANNGFNAPSGKQFKEWNTLSSGLGTPYNPGDEITNFTSPLELFAIWEDVTSVSFNATTDNTGATSIKKLDVTMTTSNGVLNNGSEYRIYKSATLTFTRDDNKKIGLIEFTGVSGNPISNLTATSGGTLTTNGNNGTWEGAASTVTFTASVAQARATLIVVHYHVGADVDLDKESLTLTVGGSSSTVGVSSVSGITNPSYEWSRTSGDDCVTLSNSTTSEVTIAPKGSVFAACGLTLTVNGDNLQAPVTREVSVFVARAISSANPYSIVEAKHAIDLNNEAYLNNAYVAGIVSQVDSYNSTYHSITYWISDDGTTANQLEAYGGLNLNGGNFSSIDDVEVGASVIITGTLKKHNSTYEFDLNNELVSYTAPTRVLTSIELSGTYPTEFLTGDVFSHGDMVVTARYDNGSTQVVTNQATFSGYDMSVAGEQEVTVSYEENEVTKTATYNITLTYVARSNFDLYQNNTVSEGDYIFYYNGRALKNTIVSNRADYVDISPVGNTISNYLDEIVWHIAKEGDYYTIYNAAVDGYLAATGSKNQAQILDNSNDDKAKWSITSDEGVFEFENLARSNSGSNPENKWLRNNGTSGWACYGTSTGGAFSLYRLNDVKVYLSNATAIHTLTDDILRLGSSIPVGAWNSIAATGTIEDYGVMIYKTSSLENIQHDNPVEYAYRNTEVAPAVGRKGDGNPPTADDGMYSFAVRMKVTNIDTVFCAASFVVVDGQYYFFNEQQVTARSLGA